MSPNYTCLVILFNIAILTKNELPNFWNIIKPELCQNSCELFFDGSPLRSLQKEFRKLLTAVIKGNRSFIERENFLPVPSCRMGARAREGTSLFKSSRRRFRLLKLGSSIFHWLPWPALQSRYTHKEVLIGFHAAEKNFSAWTVGRVLKIFCVVIKLLKCSLREYLGGFRIEIYSKSFFA